MPFSLTAGTDDSGRRLDRLLRKALRDLPLSAVHRLLRKGAVLVDGKAAAADYRVEAGQVITVNSAPPAGAKTDTSAGAKPDASAGAKTGSRRSPGFASEKAARSSTGRLAAPSSCSSALEILFEGNGLLFLNKPAGLPVHGGQSLDSLVLSYLSPKLPPSLSFRPGPLHRLDRPTSGVIAFSSSLEGARLFSALMRERKIKKLYLAITEGVIHKGEVWRDELVRDRERKKTFIPRSGAGVFSRSATGGVKGGGAPENGTGNAADARDIKDAKTALTRVTPLAENGAYTLAAVEIESGRTHQIRAQAAGHAHPLLGDKKYGGRKPERARDGKAVNGGFFLHAWRMELPEELPCPRLVEAPIPENFAAKIRELFGLEFSSILSILSGGDVQPRDSQL